MSASIDVAYPFRGPWLVQNSPANRLHSHGAHLLGTTYAIDFVPVTHTGRTAPVRFASLVTREPADRFPGFGRPVLAPLDGVVLASRDSEPDHPAEGCPRSITR